MSKFVLTSILTGVLSMVTASGFCATFYLDNQDPGASDSNDGSESSPWLTPEFALSQISDSDVLIVKEGVYDSFNVQLDSSSNGDKDSDVIVMANPGDSVIFGGNPGSTGKIQFYGVKRWTIDGIEFNHQAIRIGNVDNRSTNITIINSTFRDTTENSISIKNGKNILIDNCVFDRIQAANSGEDVHGIDITDYAVGVDIVNSSFTDISGDGIQIGENGSTIKKITIANNQIKIDRLSDGTLADSELQSLWGNTGENGIDIKTVIGPITIEDNVISGYRPVLPGQNASGGNGVGLVIHFDAENVDALRNLIENNTSSVHIAKGPGSSGPKNIRLDNNVLLNNVNDYSTGIEVDGIALSVRDATKIKIFNNTIAESDHYLESDNITSSKFFNNVVIGGDEKVNESTSDWNGKFNAWSQQVSLIPEQLQSGTDQVASDLNLNSNYKPKSNSPVIDNGKSISSITDDKDGNPRNDGAIDIGAYEFQ